MYECSLALDLASGFKTTWSASCNFPSAFATPFRVFLQATLLGPSSHWFLALARRLGYSFSCAGFGCRRCLLFAIGSGLRLSCFLPLAAVLALVPAQCGEEIFCLLFWRMLWRSHALEESHHPSRQAHRA